ncbi:MAG: zinc-dependent metalloprotease [Cellulomonadaceae bacterium]
MEARSAARGPVDWRAASDIGALLAPPGATAPREELTELVAGLRAAAVAAAPAVLEVSGMRPADARASENLSLVRVVDRARWIESNTALMRQMLLDPDADDDARTSSTARLAAAVEVGGALALVSSKVLGQFDPYTSPGTGRLLLVAPNVLAVTRALRLDAADFRLWVALHEQTHALQFATAPWLAEHLLTASRRLFEDVNAAGRALSEGPLSARAQALGESARRFVTRPAGAGLLNRVLTAEQGLRVANVGAVMALLEGHADVTMDAVGPRVVPSVRSIRKAFDARRDQVRARDLVLRKLLGMEAKLAQYRDGAAFVRTVRRRVGRAGFNAVWTSVDTLPTAAEIAEPAAWVRRVHG